MQAPVAVLGSEHNISSVIVTCHRYMTFFKSSEPVLNLMGRVCGSRREMGVRVADRDLEPLGCTVGFHKNKGPPCT